MQYHYHTTLTLFSLLIVSTQAGEISYQVCRLNFIRMHPWTEVCNICINTSYVFFKVRDSVGISLYTHNPVIGINITVTHKYEIFMVTCNVITIIYSAVETAKYLVDNSPKHFICR